MPRSGKRPGPGPSDRHDRAWADYSKSFRREVLPALLGSAYMVSIAGPSDPDDIDLRAATEMGLMLLLDKPILVVVPRGITIPAALRRAAAVVLDDFDVADPGQQDRMAEAFRRLKAQGR